MRPGRCTVPERRGEVVVLDDLEAVGGELSAEELVGGVEVDEEDDDVEHLAGDEGGKVLGVVVEDHVEAPDEGVHQIVGGFLVHQGVSRPRSLVKQ